MVDNGEGVTDGFPNTDQNASSNNDTELQQIQSLVKADPAFAESQEYKDFMAAHNSRRAEEEGEEDEEEEEEQTDDADDDSVEDVLGLTKSSKKSKPIALNFEAPKEMIELIEKRYGVKEADTFFGSVDKWREQAQEGARIREEHDAIVNDLQSLPPELKNAVNLWASGHDFMDAFDSGSRLDWSADFDNQSKEGLVQHYFGDQYDELSDKLDSGDIDEQQYKDQISLLAKSTKRLFSEEKRALDDERASYQTRIENERKQFKKSALDSVDQMSKAYPNFMKKHLSEVRSTLVEGKLDDLFYNKDGTYKADAAELVAFAKFGKQMVETLMKRGANKGRSEANRELVDKSPTAIRKNRNTDGNQGLPKEAQDAIQHLQGGFKPRSIFD